MWHGFRYLVVASVLALAACQSGSGGTGGSSPSPGPSVTQSPGGGPTTLPNVVITRTGGIAGVTQRVQFAPDGSWVYTDQRANKTERGRLDAAQRQRLAQLVTNPALYQENRGTAPPRCADAFLYTVVVGEVSFRYEQCAGAKTHVLTEQLLTLVIDATPL